MERLRIPKKILPVVAAAGLFACSSPVPITETPTAVPPTRTPERTPTLVVPTSTPRVIFTPRPELTITPTRVEPTPNPFTQIDLENRLKLEQLKSGESTTLENVYISRIVRTPMVGEGAQGKEAYIAILGAENGNYFDGVFRADCTRDSFSLQELGPAVSIPLTRFATWDTNKRLDSLTVEAGYLIKAKEVFHKGIRRVCDVGELIQETEALFRKIPWRDLPRSSGELLGTILGEFARAGFDAFGRAFGNR